MTLTPEQTELLAEFDRAMVALSQQGVDVLKVRGMTTKPIVIVVRQPDYENVITVHDGEAQVFDIDTGAQTTDGQFDDEDEWQAWAHEFLAAADILEDEGHGEAAEQIRANVIAAKPDAD